jgi:hypothetical protein
MEERIPWLRKPIVEGNSMALTWLWSFASVAGPSSGHLLPLVNDEPHHLIPRHCPDHLRRNTEQMRMVRLDVCYFLACNRI